jgi:hypothetical protein
VLPEPFDNVGRIRAALPNSRPNALDNTVLVVAAETSIQLFETSPQLRLAPGDAGHQIRESPG